YACRAVIETEDGQSLQAYGAANIGYRPTVGGPEEAWLEVHLLDFNQEIYGARMQVVFCHYIHAEQKFDSLNALVQQIGTDVQQVRAFFSVSGDDSKFHD
ncbi:MAG TPA: riboflavin kinase, partial [Pseudohongiella sp.]|nr:riboflavin kinase [Pseudohongiella sp.]